MQKCWVRNFDSSQSASVFCELCFCLFIWRSVEEHSRLFLILSIRSSVFSSAMCQQILCTWMRQQRENPFFGDQRSTRRQTWMIPHPHIYPHKHHRTTTRKQTKHMFLLDLAQTHSVWRYVIFRVFANGAAISVLSVARLDMHFAPWLEWLSDVKHTISIFAISFWT